MITISKYDIVDGMLKYLTTKKALIVALAAILSGFISAKWLVQGNPLVALPWGALAFLSAYIANTKRESIAYGSIIGFIASYSYLWFDNTDKFTLAKVVVLIFLIIMPALFGLLCGIFCSWIGWILKTRMVENK